MWNISHLVAKTLRGDDSDFIANALVGLEVEGELRVVSLNDDLGGLLDSLKMVSLPSRTRLYRL